MTLTSGPSPVDLPATFPGIEAFALTATRLHPRRGNPSIQDSHVGGPLLWPVHEAWPYCEAAHPEQVDYPSSDGLPTDGLATPFVAVAQLHAGDVPDLWCPPGRDLLQVLWCPNAHDVEGYGPDVRLMWRTASDLIGPFVSAPELDVTDDDYLPQPCVLSPERVVEYPWWEELPIGISHRMHEHFGRTDTTYQYLASIAPGWKVGGYASWAVTDQLPMPCDNCGLETTLLLTMDSSEWDGGSASRWAPIEERHLLTDTDERLARQSPVDVMLGRDGALRVFVCTMCSDHPIRLNTQ